MTTLASQPWWTPADQAELSLLVHELVDGHHNHAHGCPTCREQGSAFCRPVGDAIQIVLDWRDRRVLHSRAVWLRRMQDFQDAANEVEKQEVLA